MAGTGEIQDVIDELLVVQNAITPPTGLKALTCYDEPPAGVLTFPCFVNLETDVDAITRSSSLRRMNFGIDMHLLFARSDQKYSVRERRQWVKKVLDAFDDAVRLNNNQPPAQYAPIESVSFDNVTLPGGGQQEYIAATFRMTISLSEAFTFGA